MLGGNSLEKLLFILAHIAPFTFTFFLIHAIKRAITDTERDIVYGIGAAVSLLILVLAVLYL